MISVLIPTYNYVLNQLIESVHKQLIKTDVPFEILFLEDGSSAKFISQNRSLDNLPFTTQLINDTNKGRLNTRKELSERAQFDWLLFIDADTIPKSHHYINNYLDAIDEDTDAIFGGFAYYDKAPESDFLLRWRYGRTFEVKAAKLRNKKPYKQIISANFMIKKSVLRSLKLSSETKRYGHDSYFSGQLKLNQIRVKHLDNEVYHLGIERSADYLHKKEQAAKTLIEFYQSGQMPEHDNSLLRTYEKIRRLGLHHVGKLGYRILGKALRSNLVGNRPNVYFLQVYRLLYLCHIAT